MNTWFPKQIIIVIVAISLAMFALIYPKAAYAADITVSDAGEGVSGDGNCSLREAIHNANNDNGAETDCATGSGADRLILYDWLYTLAKNGVRIEDNNLTGDLDIKGDLTIVGVNPATTIIQAGTTAPDSCGDCYDRVFHIFSGFSVTMTRVTIRHGRAEDGTSTLSGESGGGIKNQGNLHLINAIVTKNHAGNGYNSSILMGGFGGNGGGIQNLGTLTAINSRITHNHAGDGGSGWDGVNGGFGGYGGGVYSGGDSVVSLTNTLVADNRAGDGGAGANSYELNGGDGGDGGHGGGISCGNCSLTLVLSSVMRNYSGLGGNGGTADGPEFDGNGGNAGNAGHGGGIHLDGSFAYATIFASWVHNNEASDGGLPGYALGSGSPGIGGIRGNGGGIYAIDDSQWSATGSTISNNTARNGGGTANYSGASAIVYNTTFSGNDTIYGNGGGIYAEDGTSMELTFSTITENTVSSSGDGGGFWHYGTFTITNNIIAGNHSGPSFNEDCRGFPVSLGYNVIGIDWSGCFPTLHGTDQVGTKSVPIDPVLSPLADNGGATRTHALTSSASPAFNQIPNGINGCSIGTTKDQRGVHRINTCDIGAYELVYFIYLPLIMR